MRRPDQTRVLFIVTSFVNGGAERDVARFVRALRSDGYQVALMIGADSTVETARRLCPSVPLRIEPHLRRAIHPVHDALAVVSIARFIRRNRFDVVVTCTSKAGIIGRTSARLAGVRTIYHSLVMANFGESFGGLPSMGFRAAERIVGRWTSGYFPVGEDLRDRYLRQDIGSRDRHHVVRSPIDVRRFLAAGERGKDAARRELSLDPTRPVIAYVGRLEQRKGVLELPRYVSELRRLTDTPPLLLIAGEGELRDELERAFERAGLHDNVSLLGFTDAVPSVLAAADCLVLLSRAEGLPQVMVQAAATRTPFVSYPVDGAAEMLSRGARGEIVPFGAPRAAARATVRLLGACPGVIDLREWDAPEVERDFRLLFARLTGICVPDLERQSAA